MREEKKKRNKKKYNKLVEFTRKHRIALAKREGTYKPGMYMHGDDEGEPQQKKPRSNKPKKPKYTGPCLKCGQTTSPAHQRVRSKLCRGNPQHPQHQEWLDSQWNPKTPGHRNFVERWKRDNPWPPVAVVVASNNEPDNAASLPMHPLLVAASMPRPEEESKQEQEELTNEDKADDIDAMDRIELHDSDCEDDSSVELEEVGRLCSEGMLDEDGNEV